MANRRQKRIVSRKHVARLERERRQSLLIRNIAIGIVVAIILLLGYGYLDQTVLQLHKPVARVGDETISIIQFQARVRLERQRLIDQYIQTLQFGQALGFDTTSQTQPIEDRLNSPLVLGKSVLDAMINERLYQQEAAKRGITVTPEEVEDYIRSMFGFFPDGTPTPTITPTEVTYPTLSPEQLALVTITPTATDAPTSTPAPTASPDPAATPTAVSSPTPTALPTLTPTPYTLEGYQQQYQNALPRYTDLGLTEEDVRALFESQLYFNKLYEVITADVPHEGEQVWARHILVPDAALANVIRERLKSGEDFATLAAQVSLDTSNKDNGGDLGWFSRGTMVTAFEDAAFNLEVGEISEPVQTDFGFHIIQVLGHENRPLSADEYQKARDTAFQEWLAQVREEANIEIYDIWMDRIPSDPDLQQALQEAFGQPQPAQ
ncbi:MAG: hypothetical protein GXP40_03760 [Chloroflexi bacterium]|nr:hypothetical protein [Chloroflexota bacterium]